ncbi:MAG: class I SAM-dependent methyltransferase [Solirubrobacterales bacterium]
MGAKLDRQQQDWEELAQFNPEWAVLSEPGARFAGWDMDEFFRLGTEQIEQTMGVASELGLPERRESVLDFGCGVGRLSRELGRRFERYVGVDISPGMVERARTLNADSANCDFIVNDRPDLSRFADGEFDAVVSFIVLQHLPERDLIRAYISEFGRVLAPGGLIAFQLPSEMPLIYRILWRKRLYRVARALGMSVERAHRLGLDNMTMQALPVEETRRTLEDAGCEVVRAHSEQAMHGDTPIRGSVSTDYYATRR